MNIFDKLMLSRQVSFQDGRIELLGQRVVISPSDFFASYVLKINDRPELVTDVYLAAKQATRDGFATNLGKANKFTFEDYSQWLVDLAILSGWGQIKWVEREKDKLRGVLSATDSPVALNLKGKVKRPCDHVIRGLMAGGASSAFRANVEIIEYECEALGHDACKFVIGTPADLCKRFPALYKAQLRGIPIGR